MMRRCWNRMVRRLLDQDHFLSRGLPLSTAEACDSHQLSVWGLLGSTASPIMSASDMTRAETKLGAQSSGF